MVDGGSMTNLVAASLLILAGLLLIAICADRGILAALEGLAFAIDRGCGWIRDKSMRLLLGIADDMRHRRDRIEAENEGRREELRKRVGVGV